MRIIYEYSRTSFETKILWKSVDCIYCKVKLIYSKREDKIISKMADTVLTRKTIGQHGLNILTF